MLRMCQLVPGCVAKITKLFIYIEKKLARSPGSPYRVTLHPGPPYPLSQLCYFSCKHFAASYKETYEKLPRPGWLGMEGNPPTRTSLLHINRPLTKTQILIQITNFFSKLGLVFFSSHIHQFSKMGSLHPLLLSPQATFGQSSSS